MPLIDLEQDALDRIVAMVPGGVANVQDIYPLAPLQEGVLFHHLLDPVNDPYVIDKGFYLVHSMLVDPLIDALNAAVARHDALRTVILTDVAAQPIQVVLREAAVRVTRVQLDLP